MFIIKGRKIKLIFQTMFRKCSMIFHLTYISVYKCVFFFTYFFVGFALKRPYLNFFSINGFLLAIDF